MDTKNEAQIEKEKQAVAAMTNAKANMHDALSRIQTLETALKSAHNHLGSMRYYVGEHAKIEATSGSHITVKAWLADRQAEIAKVLP